MNMVIYRLLVLVLSPLVALLLLWRLLKGKENKTRLHERFGKTNINRPKGKLLWIHCASVGESLSVLPLIQSLLNQNESLHILVSTGTVTSASLMKKRLPKERTIHQFVPIDFYPFVRRFINHWRPDVSVFIESDFWPELLHNAPNPVLINARISHRSYAKYMKMRWFFQPLISRFKMCYCQSEQDAKHLEDMGAPHVKAVGNLKYDAPALSCDDKALASLKQSIGNRPVLLASSTHNPEEKLFAEIASRLSESLPNLLTIIVPRHPNRGEAIAADLAPFGTTGRYSKNEQITDDTRFYVGDTIGDMGLWYRLAHLAVMGGSFIQHGGQNPLEALRLNVITLTGPHMFNFTQMVNMLKSKSVLIQTDSADALEMELKRLFAADNSQRIENIQTVMQNLGGATQACATLLLTQLNKKEK